MLAPRSARAKHSSNSGKSHGEHPEAQLEVHQLGLSRLELFGTPLESTVSRVTMVSTSTPSEFEVVRQLRYMGNQRSYHNFAQRYLRDGAWNGDVCLSRKQQLHPRIPRWEPGAICHSSISQVPIIVTWEVNTIRNELVVDVVVVVVDDELENEWHTLQ
ncbi:hypothetical protein Tco_1319120 [Tanacetum coccineum]